MAIHRTRLTLFTALLSLAFIAFVPAAANAARTADQFDWRVTPTGTTEEFRGLAAVSASVAWVSGEEGSVLRTTDGGASWVDRSPAAAEGLALRDIEAFDAQRAVALSIGPGEDSRIFRTSNGGRTWVEVFRNSDEAAFYDCMAFSPNGRGLALSDPVDGFFRLAATSDRGRTWHVLSTAGMPAALDGEFAFAASGTCIVSAPGGNFWFATGGVERPRIFHSSDFGQHWTVAETPLRGGPTAGIYSIDFRNARQGVIVGGDFADETNGSDAAATTTDGGQTWRLSTVPVGGYRSGVAYVSHGPRQIVAVGPTGSDVSVDGGRTWRHFDDDRYDSIQCVRNTCWASGTDGRVAVLVR